MEMSFRGGNRLTSVPEHLCNDPVYVFEMPDLLQFYHLASNLPDAVPSIESSSFHDFCPLKL